MFSFSIASVTSLTLLRHSADRYADALMRTLMRCHLPSAYGILGRFSIENPYLQLFWHHSILVGIFMCFSGVSKVFRCVWGNRSIIISQKLCSRACGWRRISLDAYAGIAAQRILMLANSGFHDPSLELNHLDTSFSNNIISLYCLGDVGLLTLGCLYHVAISVEFRRLFHLIKIVKTVSSLRKIH